MSPLGKSIWFDSELSMIAKAENQLHGDFTQQTVDELYTSLDRLENGDGPVQSLSWWFKKQNNHEYWLFDVFREELIKFGFIIPQTRFVLGVLAESD